MAYAFVQAANNSATGSGTTVVLTFGSDVAVGNKVMVQVYVAANRTFTLSENGSGTALVWRSVRRNILGSPSDPLTEVFEADNVNKTGLTQVTITMASTSATRYATGAEYSGLKAQANVGVGFFQSNAAGTIASAQTSSMTPSAVPCALVSFAVADNSIGSRPLDTSSPTVYLTNNRASQMTNQMRLGDTRGTVSQVEQVTWSWSGGNQRFGLTLAAFEETVLGPTITVQPVADTVILTNETTATFSVTATGTGTLLYDWELEDGVASGVYANLANGNGATWTGQTASSCTATLTAKTLSGRRVRCNVTDDNGTTTTNAVALTIFDGPQLTTFPATNGSGVSTATLTCDYVTGTGEAIEVRIPLSDGDVAVTVTTT